MKNVNVLVSFTVRVRVGMSWTLAVSSSIVPVVSAGDVHGMGAVGIPSHGMGVTMTMSWEWEWE